MSEKINVLLIEPGKYPKQIEIEDTLEAMQETVGGYIEEYMPFDDEVAIVCNEEGKMNGAELNRAIYSDDKEILDIIAGKFFIAYAPIESESFLSMPKDLMKSMRISSGIRSVFIRRTRALKRKHISQFQKIWSDKKTDDGATPESLHILSEQCIWIAHYQIPR